MNMPHAEQYPPADHAEQRGVKGTPCRVTRLRDLHEASLRLAAAAPTAADDVVALLKEIVGHAVNTVGGRDGRLVLKDDPAWWGVLDSGVDETGPGSCANVPEAALWRVGVQGKRGEDGAKGLGWMPGARGTGAFRSRWHPDAATMHVLDTGEQVTVPDTSMPSRFGSYSHLAARGIRSFVIVPLSASERALGALTVSFELTQNLATADVEVLTLFARHAAAALERTRLVRSDRRRSSQLEQLATILAQVGAAQGESLALETLLRGAVGLLEGEVGVAILHAEEREHEPLLLVLAREEEAAAGPGRGPAADSDGVALSTAHPTVVGDLLASECGASGAHELLRTRGARSTVSVPLLASGARIGSVHVGHRVPGYFDHTDLAAAEALASLGGAALERARSDRVRTETLLQVAEQERELAARRAEAAALQRLDVLKSELLSTISHELRTPLTIVHGYAQRLRLKSTGLRPEVVADVASRIEASSAQLRRLVEQLMDFSRLERGEVALRIEDFDLGPALRELLESLRTRPGGDRLKWRLPRRMPVRADRDRVAQIVMNLTENATKYASSGAVTIKGFTVEHDDTRGTGNPPGFVRIEVHDEGPGIPDHLQHKIWEKFTRIGLASRVHAVPGSGIGLAVVKSLAEAQGGRVGVESAPGSGAVFWVELPTGGPTTEAPGGSETELGVSYEQDEWSLTESATSAN